MVVIFSHPNRFFIGITGGVLSAWHIPSFSWEVGIMLMRKQQWLITRKPLAFKNLNKKRIKEFYVGNPLHSSPCPKSFSLARYNCLNFRFSLVGLHFVFWQENDGINQGDVWHDFNETASNCYEECRQERHQKKSGVSRSMCPPQS